MSPCSTPATMSKYSVSPSGDSTFTLVFLQRIVIATKVSLGMPYASRICYSPLISVICNDKWIGSQNFHDRRSYFFNISTLKFRFRIFYHYVLYFSYNMKILPTSRIKIS